jgi:hypothetical protein
MRCAKTWLIRRCGVLEWVDKLTYDSRGEVDRNLLLES